MSQAVQGYANALFTLLSGGGGWSRGTSDLLPSAPSAVLLTHGKRAALLLVPGDGIKPGQFRNDMESLVRRAKAPPTTRVPGPAIPWDQLIVTLVFESPIPADVRTFVGNDRRPITPRQVIQGGWVDLSAGTAGFRQNKTPFESDLLERMSDAVAEASSAGGAASGRSGARKAPPSGNDDRATIQLSAAAIRAASAEATEEDPEVAAFEETFRKTRPWATWALIALCCAVQGVVGVKTFSILWNGGAQADIVLQGQWWRLAGAQLVHLGWLHLIFSMAVLFALGSVVERYYGHLTFLALYAFAGTAGAVGTLYYGGGDLYGGASAGLFGLLGALGVIVVRHYGVLPGSVKRLLAVAVFLLVGYAVLFATATDALARVAALTFHLRWAAHLIALAAGIAFAVVVPSPKMAPSRLWLILSPLLVMCAVAPFAAEGWTLWKGRPNAPRLSYTDPKGFTLQAPPLTIMVKGQDGAIFMGATYNIHVAVHAAPSDNIEGARKRILFDLDEERGVTVKSSDIALMGGRRWLVARGVNAAGQERQYAFAIEGPSLFEVMMWGTAIDGGMNAFRSALESFTTPSSASVAPPVKKPSNASKPAVPKPRRTPPR